MAKHLALEERPGVASEIDLDHRSRGSAAVAVNRLGYELLACAVLAHYEHRGIGRRYALDSVEHIQQGRTTAYDERAVKTSVLRPAGRSLSVEFESGRDALEQHTIVPRLCDEIKSSSMNTTDGKRDTAPGSHQYHRHVGTKQFDLPEQSESLVAGGKTRVIHVEHDQRGGFGSHYLHSLIRRRGCHYLIARTCEQHLE